MAQQCEATAKSTGERCARFAIEGGRTCRVHGAAAPQVKAAAARRMQEQEREQSLRRGLAAAYGDQVPPIDPAEAMLQAVSWKYAEVLALRAKVAELNDNERVWGVTKITTGDAGGTTQEAKANAWWAMLQKAEESLVRFAAAARAAGCDERRVRIAETQGDLVATALRAILAALLDVVIATVRALFGAPTAEAQDALQQAWSDAVAEIVPAQLRLIAGGAA